MMTSPFSIVYGYRDPNIDPEFPWLYKGEADAIRRRNIMTKNDLALRLHNAGLGDWVQRADRDEMLRIAELCVEALEALQSSPEPEVKPIGWADRTDVENLREGTFYVNFMMVSKHGPGDRFNVPVYEGPRAIPEGAAAEFVRQAIKEKLARDAENRDGD